LLVQVEDNYVGPITVTNRGMKFRGKSLKGHIQRLISCSSYSVRAEEQDGRWIELAKDRVQWQALVLAALNLGVLLAQSFSCFIKYAQYRKMFQISKCR